jgi:hypothetical protein
MTKPALMRSAATDGVRCLVDSLKDWVVDSLPAIEEGICRAGADPIELVVNFQPWVREALQEIGPNLPTVTPGECQELISIIGRVIDAIERVYLTFGQEPAIGLGYLDGLDDFLVGLAFRSRDSGWKRGRASWQ